VLNRKVPLLFNKIYTLEDIYQLSKTALNRMCWRFDVSGWVGNVPNLLRDAIANIPRFADLYQSLDVEEQQILNYACECAGSVVPMEEIYNHFTAAIPKKRLYSTVKGMVQEGWLLDVDHLEAVIVVPDFKTILKVIPTFYSFLDAELSKEERANQEKGQFFSDLVEMAAFLYVEKPKLTTKGIVSKTILRRLVARLSPSAAEQWEEAAVDNLYTPKVFMLFHGLHEMNALKISSASLDGRYYEFNAEKWDDFIFSPRPHRLLAALSWELSRINLLKRGSLPFVVSLLKNGCQTAGKWHTSATLMKRSIVPESAVAFLQRDPFGSEEWLESIVLEPLLYLGLFEKRTEKLEVPWRKETSLNRKFWRLTPLGEGLAQWLGTHKDGAGVLMQICKADLVSKEIALEFAPLFALWQEQMPAELEQQLIIQPDLSFIVPRYAPPYLLWILSVFATTQIQEYVYQGSFSRDSILRALKGGVGVGELFNAIRDHCKVPPGDNVLTTLKHWCDAYDQTVFAKVTVLACDTPEMATEVAAQSKLSGMIIGQIGPQTLLIKPDGESIIRKWLEKKNWVPRPGMISGEGLDTWLQKK